MDIDNVKSKSNDYDITTTTEEDEAGDNIQTEYELVLHKCPDCDYTTTFFCSFQDHIGTHRLECPVVSTCPSSEESYESDDASGKAFVKNESHSDEKSNESDRCNETLFTDEMPYKCDVLDHQETSDDSRTINRRKKKYPTGGGKRSYKCDRCDSEVQSLTAFKYHMVMHSGKKPYKCHVCSKAFTQKGGLKTHLRSHTGEKPYACDACSKTFRTKSLLRLHSSRHAGKELYECRVCHKGLTNKLSLQCHMRSHTGEKPYKCEVCKESFGQSWSYKYHTMKYHTGDRPYKCGECDEGFLTSTALRQHAIKHTGAKPYKCDVCGGRFTQSGSLKSHKKAKHATA